MGSWASVCRCRGMVFCAVLLMAPGSLAWGQASAGSIFQSTVLPTLNRECAGCHGSAQALSRLSLANRDAVLKGGTRGPAIVAGDSRASLLMKAIEGRDGLPQMPPGGVQKKLAAETIAAFRAWIDGGAPWGEAKPESPWGYKEADLWAFRPLGKTVPGKTIDDFINATLAERAIAPAPKADRRTLIRRVTFDLTGLPPTPDEVEGFVNDRSPDAWKQLVERLLASPRYGEKWGRHWLDVVRYADSGGYSNDFERPNAWRYRDYVIRAFNQDKPYDQFIREQIAGDELYPASPEAIIATGFLRAGPWEHTAMSVEAVTRQMFLDDVTHSTAATFLGLTLGCARCHDHKFDPLPTRDYYRMQAIFASTEFARPRLPFLAAENTSDLADGAAQMRERDSRIAEAIKRYRQISLEAAAKKAGVTRVDELPKEVASEAVRAGLGLSPEKYEELKLFEKHHQLFQESLDRYEPKAFAVSSGPLDGMTDGGPSLRYPKRDVYRPNEVHILPGGNVQAPAEAVQPGVLTLLEKYGDYPARAVPESTEGRRSVLAAWIADPKNPLTARVMVNRIWHWHFGKGLAADPNNLGKMGGKPSHPELLDWLARTFMDSGWSIKSIHRVILLSDTYQRLSAHSQLAAIAEKDPDNRLLSFFPPRRLTAEELRDTTLAVAGELSRETGGPGVFPQINDDVARQPQHRMGSLAPAYHASALKRQRNRRTIYTFQQRSLIDPMIEVFNGPSLDMSCDRRESSTVPTQAFTLFNGQFVHDMALAMAARLEKASPDTSGQIELAFRLSYGRLPTAAEISAATENLKRMTVLHQKTPPPPKAQPKPLVHQITSELTGESFEFTQQEDPVAFEPNLHPSDASPRTRALADLALVLLNSNEFVYVY